MTGTTRHHTEPVTRCARGRPECALRALEAPTSRVSTPRWVETRQAPFSPFLAPLRAFCEAPNRRSGGRPSAPSSGRPVVVEPQWPARNGLYAAGSQLLGARAAVSAQAAPRQAGAALGRGSPRSGEGSARKRANCAGTLCDLRQHGSRGKPRDGAGWRRSRARMPRRGPAAGAGGMCAFRTWNAREARRGAGSQMGGLEGPPRDLRDRRASGPDPRSHAICGCSAQQGFAVGR